jgi:shikimate kinase
MSARGEAIVLIGFSGSGKTSVGRELALLTGLNRYDTDEMISARLGLSIPEIFAQLGEERFRDAETEVLAQMSHGAAVIVTGGGIVLREENARVLRALGTVVWLTADEETLLARVARELSRPLLSTTNPRETLRELLRVRRPQYEALADVTIDTASATSREVAELILENVSSRSQIRTR